MLAIAAEVVRGILMPAEIRLYEAVVALIVLAANAAAVITKSARGARAPLACATPEMNACGVSLPMPFAVKNPNSSMAILEPPRPKKTRKNMVVFDADGET